MLIDYKKSLRYVPAKLDDRLPKIYYKISDNVLKFITEAKKNCQVESTAGGKTLAELKIQGDALSSLLMVIAMMQLN